MTTPHTALDRTVLLCRYLLPDASPEAIVRALVATTVTIVVDAANLASGACQSAVVTLAQLTMEMGCSVHLVGPDAALCVEQPPWRGRTVQAVLRDMASDSIPCVAFAVVERASRGEVVFVFGDVRCAEAQGWRAVATRWSGTIQPVDEEGARWEGNFPMGGLAAATLAATEVFKGAMRKLGPTGPHIDELAPGWRATVALADESTPCPSALGRVDCISGGAIVQAMLHATRRVPGLAADVRVFEPKLLDLTNLNRYALSRRSQVGVAKTAILQECSAAPFMIRGEAVQIDAETHKTVTLAPTVVVGVDNVPSRWDTQRARPRWLVVGATSEFMAMASEHDGSGGCAGCAHPHDDGVRATVPTVSFVSYWAGLMVATRVLCHAAGAAATDRNQVVLMASIRLDARYGVIRYSNGTSLQCPLMCRSKAAA